MLKHSLLLVCAVLLLAVPRAAAQTLNAPLATPSQRSLSYLAALVPTPAVAVRLHNLEGPKTLKVDEDGLFTAFVNLETASLPLRSRWTFGDGTTARGLHARHRFAEPGTYTVVFTVWNDHGAATDSLTVQVTRPSAPEGSGHPDHAMLRMSMTETVAHRRFERSF